MSAVRKLVTGPPAAALVAALALCAALAPSPAYAGDRSGGGNQGGTVSGTEHGGTIGASAGGITYDTSHNGSGGGHAVGSLTAAGNWQPPPCWYAPMWSPDEFSTYVQGIWSSPSVGWEWVNTQRDRYVNGHPYKDFNKAKAGKGYWWNGVANLDRIAEPAALSCDAPYFWVDKGKPAPEKNAISPELLAQLAYKKVRVPGTDVTLNPAGTQTVNLNTWAWLDKATFRPVSVTASAPLIGISATTTATPIALHLVPGTPDAVVHPASGDCPIQANGRIGTPYRAADGNGVPPCGITYEHATSGRGPFQMRATVTWKVSWTGTGGAGGALPNGTFGTTTPVTVQEIQSVVR